MERKIKVLWLPAWFPSEQDFLNGDFIERHAQAVSKYAEVTILYVFRDVTLKNNKYNIQLEKNGDLTIYRAFYNCTNKWNWIGKLYSSTLFFFLQKKIYKLAKKESGNFDLVHVQISQRQALFALFLKLTKKLKYVITEQNSWFMPFGNKAFTNGLFLKYIVKLNFKNASAIHVVSKSLGKALKNKYSFINDFIVIPNVVNNNLFFPLSNITPNESFVFFAITGNTYHKNTDGVIRAFDNFIKQGYNAYLRIAGPNIFELNALVKKLAIESYVKFYDSIPQISVSKLMQTCDAFIFFTRYETFGCVLAEALCCGKPVIASRLDVLQENLQENINAVFVESENENDLSEKLIYFVNNIDKFNNKKIAENAIAKYNFDKVGQDFLAFYNTVLEK